MRSLTASPNQKGNGRSFTAVAGAPWSIPTLPDNPDTSRSAAKQLLLAACLRKCNTARRYKLWKAEKDMAARRCRRGVKIHRGVGPRLLAGPAKATGLRRRASTPHPEVEYEITPDEWRAKTCLSARQRLSEVH
jgi:hypothetical protein